MSELNIELLHDRIIVKPDEAPNKTASGLLLSPAVYKATTGTVIEIGNCKDGYTMTVKVGDKVMYEKGAGTEFKRNDKTYLLMREQEIIWVDKKL